MKAVIIKDHGTAITANIKEQTMQPDYVRVKTVAVAVNPTDLHHTCTPSAGRVGGILGCDLSGVIEEVGSECKTDLKKGDAVYAAAHCANLSTDFDGAFAEFALVRDGILAKVPANLTFEQAATLGTGITTVGQVLYLEMQLPLPGEQTPGQPATILISGGSSASGSLTMQFAKLSGLKVVATASPDNFEFVKSRGADAVFDYNDPDCAKKIREYGGDDIRYVLDCISTEPTFKLISNALPEKLSHPVNMITLLPADAWPRDDIKPKPILAYTSLGKPFSKFGISFPAFPEHYEHAVMFWKVANDLLAAGKIVPHPIAMRPGGLDGIPGGLKEHAEGKVRAVKLVYMVDDVDAVGKQEVMGVKAPELGSNW